MSLTLSANLFQFQAGLYSICILVSYSDPIAKTLREITETLTRMFEVKHALWKQEERSLLHKSTLPNEGVSSLKPLHGEIIG